MFVGKSELTPEEDKSISAWLELHDSLNGKNLKTDGQHFFTSSATLNDNLIAEVTFCSRQLMRDQNP